MTVRTVSKQVTDEVLICLRRIIQMIDIHSRYLVKTVGLTGPQLTILQVMDREGELSTGELARAISLSQATVTGILERLEKRHLIDRRRSDVDRRKVLVNLTDHGHKLLAEAPPLLQAAFVNAFGELENWEQSMILSSLQRLVSLMEAKTIASIEAKTIEDAPILATGPFDNCMEPEVSGGHNNQ